MPETEVVSEPDFAAFVAIDWADQEHAWSLQEAGSSRRERGRLQQTPEALEAWAAELARRFPGRPVAVALEQARGAVLYGLSQYGHLVLYPVHPAMASRFRAALHPSGVKDDPSDADLLLDILVQHRGRLRSLQPDTPATRQLQLLVEKRRQLVDLRTAQTNRIRDLLKIYFPQVLEWFEDLAAPIVEAFLQRWPTLERVQQEEAATLRQFFHQHHSRSRQRMQERWEQIRQARPALEDRAIIDPSVQMVQALLAVVAALRPGIARMDRAIQEVAASHPDYALFCSFPSAGPVLAPRLLAAFGSRRERFQSAQEVQAYSGIAPVQSRSGAHRWIHFRWACPKFLRQTFHEYAARSLLRCDWAREFYQTLRAKGKKHHAAVRALAFKWIRILFRCWQSRQPYQESIWTDARKHRRYDPPAPPAPPPPRAHRGKSEDRELKPVGAVLKSLLAQA
jgi:transposase